MTDYLKHYIKECLDLIDEEMYDELYSNCNIEERTNLTEFLLSCNIKPDEYMTVLPEGYLMSSQLNSYVISPGIEVIENNTFHFSKINSINIPDSVTSIGRDAFYNCRGLTNVTFGESSQLTSIGERAFYGCGSLTSIEIPASVTSIGYEAFYLCTELTSIKIPASVTSIGKETFLDCSSLTSVEIPTSVMSIGDYAFCKCSKLLSIHFNGTTEEWKTIKIGSNAFYNVPTSVVRCTDGVTRTL